MVYYLLKKLSILERRFWGKEAVPFQDVKEVLKSDLKYKHKSHRICLYVLISVVWL